MKRTMKAILVVMLVVMMMVSVAACSPAEEAPMKEEPAKEEAAPAEEAEEAAPTTWTSDAGNEYNLVAKEDIIIGFNQGSNTVDFLRMVGENIEEIAIQEANYIKVKENL